MSFPFDPTDPAIHRWLTELNVAMDDMRAVVDDMFLKKRDRALGHQQHVSLFEGGWDKAAYLLGRAPPEPSAPAASEVTH